MAYMSSSCTHRSYEGSQHGEDAAGLDSPPTGTHRSYEGSQQEYGQRQYGVRFVVLIGPTRDRNSHGSETSRPSGRGTHRSYEGSQRLGQVGGLPLPLVLIGPTRDRNTRVRVASAWALICTHRSYEGSQLEGPRSWRWQHLWYSSVLRGIATRPARRRCRATRWRVLIGPTRDRNTCGRPTAGASHSGPTTSRTRPTNSASCPARSPVIRSQRGGCPSIIVVHTTEVIYPRAAAVSDRDTSQVDHSPDRASLNVTVTSID